MTKDSTYKEKYAMLKNWMPFIIDSVKKDLRNEHLKKDWGFVKQYFSSKNINKLTTEELAEAYNHALANGENPEELGEFLTNRWLLKNTEVYHFFETELSKVSPNFTEIEELDHKLSHDMMQKAVNQFGSPKTYLFCILNSVVFPRDVLDELATHAQKTVESDKSQALMEEEKASLQHSNATHEQQLARLKDKYEKKIIGLEKKYHQDTESLKKQIAILQRKLNPAQS